jgi:hypothetical protein
VLDVETGVSPQKAKLVGAFAAVYVLWGSTYLAIRFGVETIPPFLMAGTRHLAAGLLLYLWLRLRGGGARPDWRHWRTAPIGGMMPSEAMGSSRAERRVPPGSRRSPSPVPL